MSLRPQVTYGRVIEVNGTPRVRRYVRPRVGNHVWRRILPLRSDISQRLSDVIYDAIMEPPT